MSNTRTPALGGQDRARTGFRVGGIVLLLLALVLLGVGLTDFFSALSSEPKEPADRAWIAFIGLLLLGPAGWCLQEGFMGSPPNGLSCGRCGSSNDEAAKACDSCGAALAG